MPDIRRREFITLLGSTAATWPLAARAQQAGKPVIGFLTFRAPGDTPYLLAAVRQGLKDTGFAEGQNVAIEYRFAGHKSEQLPALAADLVHRRVTAIVAITTPAALAAKAATTTIPIVFETGGDPVQLGLVASLNRRGGNATGVSQLSTVVAAKRLELLHELVPTATVMALLIDPTDPVPAESVSRALQAAARSFGLELHVLSASSERDFDAVFAKVIQLRAGGLVIGSHAFFTAKSEQLAALAVRYAVPTVYAYREFVAAGGLASYGGSIIDAYRLAGVYAARILKGEKPADLPVQEVRKVELFLNLKAAKALGITVPLPLSGRADEARPSGNVTGVFFQQIELAAKRIQLVKDAFPNMSAATMFWDRASADQWQASQNVAPKLGLRLFGIELHEPPYDYERAFGEAPADHRGMVIVATSAFFFRDRERIADFALRHRIASMFVFREWAEAGGLLSYGPSISAQFVRVAEFVDRIARGAKPADLPIEQPTKFELVVNLKTARAIGIELPTAILLRADEVIE